jgi:hypothetical protein
MRFPSPSRRARRGLFALALALPLLSLASLAGAAAWVWTHGGLAGSLTSLVRTTALLAGGLEALPGTLTAAQAAALQDQHAAACGFTWVTGDGDSAGEDDFSFAMIEPDGKSSFSLNGDDRSHSRRLDRLMRSADAPTLWFREGDHEYVVTDPATVERARALCEPLQRIGSEMGRVGGEMGRIGGRLGRYGGRLGALGGRLGGVSARLAVARLSSDERDQLEAERDRLQEEMDRVQAEMESLENGSIRERQGELSRRMEELSKQHQEALARARAGLRLLFDEVRARQKSERPEPAESSI